MIRCADGSLYTGITTDLERRFDEHAQSADANKSNGIARAKGAKSLRGKGPLKIAFTTPAEDRSIASKIEYRIKQLSKAQKEALVVGKLSVGDIMSAAEMSD